MSWILFGALLVLLYLTLEASLAHKAVRDMTGHDRHGSNGTWCESSPYLQDARETRRLIFTVMIIGWPTYIYALYTYMTVGF